MIDPPHRPSPAETIEGSSAVHLRTDLPEDRSESRAETIELLEETLHLSKREVLTGTVRVSTRTESFEDFAEIPLDRILVDVTRVPVGKTIEAAPAVRIEGDTTIVPVVEERFVIVKQLYLKEELHIRRRVETEVSRTPVILRRQTAVIERTDAEGHILTDASIPQD